VPAIGAGEKLIAVFLARVEGTSFAPDSIRELTGVKDGIVNLENIPAGPHEALFFISSRTGMQVKTPAVGAEGFVLDHMKPCRHRSLSKDRWRSADAGVWDESALLNLLR
jgi:hypothetical protein